MQNKLSRENGNNLVELAILLPLLLLLVLGTFDLGKGFNTYIALSNSAREGARWLTLYPTDKNGALNRVFAEANSVGLAGGDLTVTFTPDLTTYPAGQDVTVNVAHDYPLLFGLITNIPSVPFNIQATMRVLYEP